MTNERAIKLLNRISDSQFDGIHGDERREALEMAVRALEQNLVQESGGLVKDLVKDCISRQQAINAFEPEHDTDWYTPQIIEVLEALPPVQPTQTNADSTHENTLDCVSRQQAIDALAIGEELLKRVLDDVDVVGNEREKYEWGLGLIEAYIADMKDLPSAQPERKTARWEILYPNHTYKYHCSECGANHKYMFDFCPSCGAYMGDESDETN